MKSVKTIALLALAVLWQLTGRIALGDDQPAREKSPTETKAPLAVDSVFEAVYGLTNGHTIDTQLLNLANGPFLLQRAPESELGAALTAIEEAARVQLGLQSGQGLVVSNINPEGQAAKVGLMGNDILLSLGDKVLGKPDDLTVQLKTAGENVVDLHVLRSGKPMKLTVKPIYRVTLGAVPTEKKNYYIGVPVQSPDETLRAHLSNLPPGQGLIASEVEKDSPADKAGLKPFDILLEFGGKPLTDTQSLINSIQEVDGRTTALKILRQGKDAVIQVTPALRKAVSTANADTLNTVLSYRWLAAGQPATSNAGNFIFMPGTQATWANALKPTLELDRSGQADKRLDEVLKELKSVRNDLAEIRKGLKKD